MDNSRDRNPSPPPELLEHDEDFVPDRIGGSMYSKRWLYKALMKMLKVVEEHDVKKETEVCSSKTVVKETENSISKSEDGDDPSQNIVELDKKIEEDACTLWDMSANSEVAEFLCECNVGDIFLTIIENTKSPRLLEIVVGILGNMSSFDSACKYISRDIHLVKAVIMLTGCSDSCTLVQVFRLLSCSVANIKYRKEWYYAFKEDSIFLNNLKNILENNLCHDVLQGLLQFLNHILNYDRKYCKMWTEEPYFMAIIESGKQLMKCNKYEDLDSFWSVLWSIDVENIETLNIPVYVDHFLDLKPLFTAYILKVGEEETLPPAARHRIIGSAYALFAKLRAVIDDVESVILENDVLKAITHTYKLFDGFLQKHMRNKTYGKKYKSFDEEIENGVITIIETKESDDDNGFPEIEDSAIEEEGDNAKFACDNIRFCAYTCTRSLKDAEGIQILGEILDLNSMQVSIVGTSQSNT